MIIKHCKIRMEFYITVNPREKNENRDRRHLSQFPELSGGVFLQNLTGLLFLLKMFTSYRSKMRHLGHDF